MSMHGMLFGVSALYVFEDTAHCDTHKEHVGSAVLTCMQLLCLCRWRTNC